MRYMLVARGTAIATVVVTMACSGSNTPMAPDPPGGTPPQSITIIGERGNQSFTPNPATTGSSRQVVWRNTDSVVHRIVSNDGAFDTGDIAPGATSPARTVAANGTNYHCSLHTTMIGAISTPGSAPPPCTGAYC